jgi:hypothetical protein
MDPTKLTIEEIRDLVEGQLGQRPSRQTIYNWLRWGWLVPLTKFRPARASAKAVLDCINAHCKRRG